MGHGITDYLDLGVCAAMLTPESFESDGAHLRAIELASALEQYTALDVFLAGDAEIAKEELRILRASGKNIRYNSPVQLQRFGAFDAGSEDAQARENALELMKKHLDYAAQLDAKLCVTASCPDVPERRESVRAYYKEFMHKACAYAKPLGITIVVEPIERHRFKKLLLGPTQEVSAFIQELRTEGTENAGLMIDFGHLPLMEESLEQALDASKAAGLSHVHFGDAVLKPDHPLYGHMHPAMCGRGGSFSMQDITQQMLGLFRFGYLDRTGKRAAAASLEVRPYDGVSAKTSAKVHFERMQSALDAALELLDAE